MKHRLLFILFILVILPNAAGAQSTTDDLVGRCVLSSGENTAYLKDFLIHLPKAGQGSALPVYKANIYLMKNMKYRFSLCDAPESKGQLCMTIYDHGKKLLSSYSSETGNRYTTVDFICNKTGLYSLWFNFIGGEAGLGVGVVSMIR